MFRGGSRLCRFENLTLMFFWPSLPNLYQGVCQERPGRGGEDGLEEPTRAIPTKVCRLKAKVTLQSSWLEALRSICPARPPDAEAAGAGGTGCLSVDESFREGSKGVAEGAGVGGGGAQVVRGNI